MLRTFANYGVNRVLGLGLSFGAYFAYAQYDKYKNYAPVQARVSHVEDLCHIEKTAGGQTSSADVACDVAESAVKNHPKWLGAAVTYRIIVDYDYVSPVDGRTHSGRRQLSAWPGGRRIVRGDAFDIRASRIDPNLSRDI